MKILSFNSDVERSDNIKHHLLQAGYPSVLCVEAVRGLNMPDLVKQHQSDMLIIDMESTDHNTLESIRQIGQETPKPIIFFSGRSDYETTQAIINAGVSVYIVEASPDNRIKNLIEIALARFEDSHRLRSELDGYKKRLEDRKDVDKAKGWLMQHRQLNEEKAYQLLRKTAMNHNMRMGDAARSFMAATALLEG